MARKEDIPALSSLADWLLAKAGQTMDAWKDRPEWADMAFAILKGEISNPEKGWWRPAAERLGWEWLRENFDKDGDGFVRREELPPRWEGFHRLDRDGDGKLEASDLGPSPEGEADALGGTLFEKLDTDTNGRVSRYELLEFFDRADRGKGGFLTREDLVSALGEDEEAAAASGEHGMPPAGPLLGMLFEGKLGSLCEGPGLLEVAPDFTLFTHDRRSLHTLSDSRGKRLVVLIFGSFT
ncbi:MAG TPA: hypothetical protein VMT52_06640 [Planctomycetota bacterium]|nr:hypothetical protein [Planctomycetota bacterium]